MATRKKIKIGIDVGGTFTHAVAVNAETQKLVGKAMVPTTHASKVGVAQGVVDSMHLLLNQSKLKPSQIALIAHSTTQATNALLEGDVAKVGIIGMGKGAEGWSARRQTKLGSLELYPGKHLTTFHRFIDTSKAIDRELVERLVQELVKDGAEVFVVSEAFGIDDRSREQRVAEIIRAMGFLVTVASDISQLYGLRVRTRTAVLNASMLPKMLETANLTERSVRESGIDAPLMIMRSDGGIMDINEMRRRPILTMLSGPAAGVAAALMFIKISDGIFLEVGGTSTDISVIKNGRPMVRSAEVGGNRLFVRTLDVRTIGIAGGSVPRASGTTIVEVGPRSAHIAGLRYLSFSDPKEFKEPRLVSFCPRPGDPEDYCAIATGEETRPIFTITPTEASNILGLQKKYAIANTDVLELLKEWIERTFKRPAETVARELLDICARKVEHIVQQFIDEYKLQKGLLALVGGGGGAEAIVPYSAKALKMEHWIADHAEVISAIGAALGMIRESIERSVVNPTDGDILKIRTDAMESVLAMGADPSTIDVRVEIDARNRRIVAVATGAPEMRMRDLTAVALDEAELRETARRSMNLDGGEIDSLGGTRFFRAFRGKELGSRFFGLIRSVRSPIRVVDHEGVIRLKLMDGIGLEGTVSSIPSVIGQSIDDNTVFGDAGGLTPDVFVLVSGRIIDLSGLVSKDQILSVLRVEFDSFSGAEPAVVILSKK